MLFPNPLFLETSGTSETSETSEIELDLELGLVEDEVEADDDEEGAEIGSAGSAYTGSAALTMLLLKGETDATFKTWFKLPCSSDPNEKKTKKKKKQDFNRNNKNG